MRISVTELIDRIHELPPHATVLLGNYSDMKPHVDPLKRVHATTLRCSDLPEELRFGTGTVEPVEAVILDALPN